MDELEPLKLGNLPGLPRASCDPPNLTVRSGDEVDHRHAIEQLIGTAVSLARTWLGFSKTTEMKLLKLFHSIPKFLGKLAVINVNNDNNPFKRRCHSGDVKPFSKSMYKVNYNLIVIRSWLQSASSVSFYVLLLNPFSKFS